MTRQLERHKGKLYDKGRGSSLARGEFSEAAEGDRNVRTEHMAVSTMSVDEAIERMEELGNNYLLFLDDGTGEMRLLFRRDGGDYGVIVPEIE
jgi:putative sigma-54 modulation protein